MKRLVLAIGLAASVAVMGLSTALAATQITAGNDVSDRQYSDDAKNFFLVDMNQPFTSDGEVDKWQIWAEKKVPVALAIFHYENNAWSLVDESDWETPTNTGLQEFTLSSKIDVESGDYVGLRIGVDGGAVSFDKANTEAWTIGNLSGSVKFTTTGSSGPADFKDSSNRKYSVMAIGTATDVDDDDEDAKDKPEKDEDGINGNGRNFGTHLSGDEADDDSESQAQGQANFKLSKDGESLKYKLNVANIVDVVSAGLYRDDDTLLAELDFSDDDSADGRFQGTLAEGELTDDDLDLDDLMEDIRAGKVYVAVFTEDRDGEPEILGWLMAKGDAYDEEEASLTDDSDDDGDDEDDDEENSEKVRGSEKHEKEMKAKKEKKDE